MSGRFDAGGFLQTQFLDHDFSHSKFLNLAGDRHRKFADDLDVARNLEGCDVSFTKRLNFRCGKHHVRFQFDPSSHLFAVLRAGNSDDLDFADSRAGVQKLFDLTRIDVFAAPDDHVFDTARYPAIAVFAHDGDIAGMQPPT